MTWYRVGLLVTAALVLCGCSATDKTAETLGSRWADLVGESQDAAKQKKPPEVIEAESFATALHAARELERRDVDEALEAYGELAKRFPQRGEVFHRLALLHDRQGRFAQSAEFYQQAFALLPDNAELHCDFGYSCYLQQRYDEAEASLRRALELDPELARAHGNFGLLLAARGRDDEAYHAFRHGGCSEADARLNLAYALLLRQQWDAARQQYKLALAADANCLQAHAGLKELEELQRTAAAR